MEYTWYQLLWLFRIYSFGGWCLEVANAAVKRKKFVNVGYLNDPFCVIYGFSAVAFAVFLPEIRNHLFFLFLGGVIVCQVLVVFMVFDIAMSGLALARY